MWGEHVQGRKHQRKLNRSSAEDGDKSQGEADPKDNRTYKERKLDRKLRKLDNKLEMQKIQDQRGLLIVAELVDEFPKEQREKTAKGKNRDQSRKQVAAWLTDAVTIEQAIASGVAASVSGHRIEAYKPYTSKAWIDHFTENAPTTEQVAILNKHGDFYSNKGLDPVQFIKSACFLHSIAHKSSESPTQLTFDEEALEHLGHI